jgi:hypothetical protein
MVSGCEHDISILHIEILVGRWRLEGPPYFGDHGLDVGMLRRQPGDHLKTGGAETSFLGIFFGQVPKKVCRNHDSMAPAGSLIKMPFGHATRVVRAADGALLTASQAHRLGPYLVFNCVPLIHSIRGTQDDR